MHEIIHTDHITDITHNEDILYLRTKLLDVNVRLFESSPQYRKVVLAACEHIKFLCGTKAEGYKLPHGMSGANAGIPWNIIGIARNRGEDNAYIQIMINPKIIESSDAIITSESNCGSIRLKKPILVDRHAWVIVSWWDLSKAEKLINYTRKFDRYDGGLTIQHEVDHNNGVLITDRTHLE